jgi:hypothetical protein
LGNFDEWGNFKIIIIPCPHPPLELDDLLAAEYNYIAETRRPLNVFSSIFLADNLIARDLYLDLNRHWQWKILPDNALTDMKSLSY